MSAFALLDFFAATIVEKPARHNSRSYPRPPLQKSNTPRECAFRHMRLHPPFSYLHAVEGISNQNQREEADRCIQEPERLGRSIQTVRPRAATTARVRRDIWRPARHLASRRRARRPPRKSPCSG